MRPPWVVKVAAAKAAVFDAMTETERAEAKAAQAQWREQYDQRKRARAAETTTRMRLITALKDAGHTTAEIAAKVGRSISRTRNFAAERGVSLSTSETHVSYAVSMSVEHRAVLRDLARQHGVLSDCQLLEWLVSLCLANGGQIARVVTRNPEAARAALHKAFSAASH